MKSAMVQAKIGGREVQVCTQCAALAHAMDIMLEEVIKANGGQVSQ